MFVFSLCWYLFCITFTVASVIEGDYLAVYVGTVATLLALPAKEKV